MTPTPEDKKTPSAKIVMALILIAIILLVVAIIATGVFPAPSQEKIPAPSQEKIPTLISLTPERGAPGTTIPVTIGGMDFAYGPTPSVWLAKTGKSNINATNVVVISPAQIKCTLTIPLSAPAGQWDVVVTNAAGQSGSKKWCVHGSKRCYTSEVGLVSRRLGGLGT